MALGVLGSRLMPPLASAANGAVRAKLGEDAFRKLEQDHRPIESTLRQMSDAVDQSPARRMKLFLVFKRTLGKHAMAEEDVVYPVIHDLAGGAQKAMEMYTEHAQMKIHLYELERAIALEMGWKQNVRLLRDVIGEPIRDEEDRGFPRVRTMLQEKQYAILAGKIRREEAMVR